MILAKPVILAVAILVQYERHDYVGDLQRQDQLEERLQKQDEKLRRLEQQRTNDRIDADFDYYRQQRQIYDLQHRRWYEPLQR